MSRARAATTYSPSRTTSPASTRRCKTPTGNLFPLGAEQCDCGHGRIERRRIWTTTALNDYLDFPYLAQAMCIERYRYNQRSGEHSSEYAYLITSRAPQHGDAHALLHASRQHWAIENRNHYVRDVTFDEDRCRIRTGSGPRIMAALRSFAISLIRQLDFASIAYAIRYFAASAARTLRTLGL